MHHIYMGIWLKSQYVNFLAWLHVHVVPNLLPSVQMENCAVSLSISVPLLIIINMKELNTTP